MIVEIFDNSVKGALRPSGLEFADEPGLTLDDLGEIFKKMELPLPREEVDISWTKDGGYNLLLNPYGAVLKIFPASREGEEQKYSKDRVEELGKNGETRHMAQIYHPSSSPPIGVVRFEAFGLQLMPGLKHSKHGQWRRDDAFYAMVKDIGCGEHDEFNYGDVKGKAVLLDTVEKINLEKYAQYHKKNFFDRSSLLDKTLKAAERYEALQQSFMAAWGGDKPFSEFWADMAQAKADGLLVDGWNHSHLDLDFKFKGGNLVEIARKYEERLNNRLEMSFGA
tara:strand:- start:3850 stop:4689 length:840 start_codon:yes stop_codon:yes gene_type:complete